MKRHSVHIVLGVFPGTLRKLCLSTKFRHKKISLNYGTLGSAWPFPNKIWFFEVNNGKTRTMYEIRSKFIIRTPERCLVFLLLILNKQMLSVLAYSFSYSIHRKYYHNPEAYSEPFQTSKMEHSVKMKAAFTIFAERFIGDVWQGSDTPLSSMVKS